ncbi:MAG TPA: peptidoglycan editing factor PgeF [Porticoccaceae bacterium]|nr:peptidoglycan editing factor PgeF [Porticoccaceae bacterium]
MSGCADDNNEFFLLRPEWPLPEGVRSVITLRSAWTGPQRQLKLNDHEPRCPAGQDADAVSRPLSQSYGKGLKQSSRQRRVLARQLGSDISVQWLNQVHGAKVVEASFDDAQPDADASYSRAENLACAVMTADCLPVLIAVRDGSAVAAAHAGWRGLAAGVIGATVQALKVEPAMLSVYLGPAICARHFEVGSEVLSAFLEKPWIKTLARAGRLDRVFQPSRSRPGHYQGDLYALARLELQDMGVQDIYGGEFCSYGQPRWFYSHRRGQDVGRTASLIWIAPA